MARVDIDWHGDEIERITQVALERAVGRGLKPIADLADERVLVHTGELKRSQVVSADGGLGAITYTDSKAVGAHENLTATPRKNRNPGAQAKFLESALHERADEAIREVADELRDVL